MHRISYPFIVSSLLLFLSLQAGCEKNNDQDKILIAEDVEVTFVEKGSGEFLIGPEKRYDPAAIKIFNQRWQDTGVVISECPDNIYVVYFKMYKKGPAEVLAFDTTYYIKLSDTDIDTLNFTYAYDQKQDYYQQICYNDSLYSERVKDFDCAILLYKKP